MKLQALHNIEKKKELHLYYRNDFLATAHFISSDGRDHKKKIEFSVEMTPTGSKEIKVEFVEKMDYPVLTLVKSLKEEIRELDRKGLLL